MRLAIIAPGRDREPWKECIQQLDPEIEIEIYPEISDPDNIEGALLWSYPYGVLNEYKNLKWISSIGAGVDYILNDPELPQDVIITRIVDKNLSRDMQRTAALAVLSWENRSKEYFTFTSWKKVPRNHVGTIGILGMGEMGKAIGLTFYQMGYNVKGYSRTEKQVSGITSYFGNITEGFLMDLDVLINVLPLTSTTEDILNIDLFAKMKKGAYIVNLGRGKHLVEEDLITAIKKGQISGAWLDVFRKEPLSDDHPFWAMPEITIMPHIASVTDPVSASRVIVENYQRLKRGIPLLHTVRRDQGY